MPDQNDGAFHFSYQIYPEHGFAIGRQSGPLTAQNLIDAISTLYQDVQWQPGYKLLWDNRGLVGISLDRKEGKRVAIHIDHFRKRIGDGKTAVVMPDGVLAMIADMLAGLSALRYEQVAIFEEMNAALTWLDLPALPQHV